MRNLNHFSMQKQINRLNQISLLVCALTLLLVPVASLPFMANDDVEKDILPVHISQDFLDDLVFRQTKKSVSQIDQDNDKIHDKLDEELKEYERDITTDRDVKLSVMFSRKDYHKGETLFRKLGGTILRRWTIINGFEGTLKLSKVKYFASQTTDLEIIEPLFQTQKCSDSALFLSRVRNYAWTKGYFGDSNSSIAILDTGIDDSHPILGSYDDLNWSAHIVGWKDATSDGALTPNDYDGHGSHMSAIAAGLEYDSNYTDDRLQTTWPWVYNNTGSGKLARFSTYINVTSAGNVDIDLYWDRDGGTPFTEARELTLYGPAPDKKIIAHNNKTGSNPMNLSTYTDAIGLHEIEGFALIEADVTFYASIVSQYPYRFINDGHARFSGVAPDTKLVGVKVFNRTGYGSTSDLITGLDWVYNNAETYHIVVASMGLDLNATVASVDAATSKLISRGLSVLAAVGNQKLGSNRIYSPAHVDGVIAVAATDDFHEIASYSSQGPGHGNVTKPDLAAPGGEHTQGGYIQADSNDKDAGGGMDDWQSDDVTNIQGTSMATSHVAGIAAILAQILGGYNSWTYDTTTNNYKIKQVLMMTAWEVYGTNRGNKDDVEGYGEVQADAAIDALTTSLTIGTDVSYTLSEARYEPKVFARNVSLTASISYDFRLAVPAGADFDMFLYDKDPNTNGEPVTLQNSTSATLGGSEAFRFTPSVSGVYYLVIKQVSGSGTFVLDFNPPDISITNPANETLTNRTTILVEWTGSDASSGIDHYEVFVDNISKSNTTSTSLLATLSTEGYINITVVAYDNAGNSNQSTIWVIRDISAPIISIISPLNETPTNQDNITVEWTGNDAGSGIDYYDVFVNGTWEGNTTGLSMNVSLPADGYHKIIVVAYDYAGNSNQSAAIWVKKETVAPLITITSPADGTLTNQDNITVQWDGSDAGSGIANYSVFVNGTWQANTTGLSMIVDLDFDGYYTILVVAYDYAGNSNQSAIWVQRDMTAPNITITSPVNGSATN
ncbi:MAG: S8 family serine peptidase, partial [Promethearchaeota archaeon]